uniref:Uncharacterized protein n=1 Tax=Anguilla anguilla TaxID=7936 RepID=A0A0E9QEW1_ANGAN
MGFRQHALEIGGSCRPIPHQQLAFLLLLEPYPLNIVSPDSAITRHAFLYSALHVKSAVHDGDDSV